MSEERREMTVREAGRLGGEKRRDAGTDYSALGKVGGRTTKERHGREHYAACGEKGGAVTAARYGADFYARIGHKGGQRVKELIAKGKATE